MVEQNQFQEMVMLKSQKNTAAYFMPSSRAKKSALLYVDNSFKLNLIVLNLKLFCLFQVKGEGLSEFQTAFSNTIKANIDGLKKQKKLKAKRKTKATQ